MQNNEELLIFHHVPKTAGTSMRLFLWKVCGMEQVFWHGDGNFLDDVFQDHGPDYFKRFTVVGGHIEFSHGNLPHLPGRKTYSAVVRRPLDQIVSHFEFVSSRPEHPLYSGQNLEKALETDTSFAKASRNMQCRFITNCKTATEVFKAIGRENFVVGCFDQLDLFVDHVATLLRSPRQPLPVENVQQPGYFDRHCTPRVRELVAEITAEDEKFYQRVREAGLLVTTLKN